MKPNRVYTLHFIEPIHWQDLQDLLGVFFTFPSVRANAFLALLWPGLELKRLLVIDGEMSWWSKQPKKMQEKIDDNAAKRK